MKRQVRLTFLGVNRVKYVDLHNHPDVDYPALLKLVEAEGAKWQNQSKIRHLKPYLKTQDHLISPPKYLRISHQQELLDMAYSSSPFEIQFFCPKNEESYRKIIMNIGIDLDQIKRCLSNLNNELKDEANQLNAPNIIRRNTSKDDETIEAFLVVCDPLVEALQTESEAYQPLYHDQIDVTSHVQRLRKASLSNSDLTIKVSRVSGTSSSLIQVLHHPKRLNSQNHLFSIVQIFTRVEKRESKLMMSLQSEEEEGRREWVAVERVLGGQLPSHMVIIVVGVGAHLLLETEELSLNPRLICITTISMEEKRILANIDERNPLDNENSYNDQFSQFFLEEFYSHLFRRNRIHQSYEHAFNLVKDHHSSKNIWCCCLHTHHALCPWPSLIARIGEPEAHRLFKHSLSQWNKPDHYMLTNQLQWLLSGSKQEQLRCNGGVWKEACCPGDNICCWQLMQVESKKALHQNLSKFITTNNKEPEEQFYSLTQNRFERCNRFQAESYDKPIGIRPPLTIFLTVKHILKHSFCILRSEVISQVKRLFKFAKEYMQVRNPCLQFVEFKVGPSQAKSFKAEVNQQVEAARKKSGERMGASLKSRTQHVYLWVVYSREKSNKYYEKLLEDYWVFARQEVTLKVKLKLILLMENQEFSQLQLRSDLLPLPFPPNSLHPDPKMQIELELHENHPLQRFHSVLSRHSYSHIVSNIAHLETLILQGQMPEAKAVLDINESSRDTLDFLGFLTQFSEEGFYLTKVTRVIVCELFSEELVQLALNGSLPVQSIQVMDCTYLQLSKPCLEHFNSLSTLSRLTFLQKKLQFYYILMRLYFELWPLSQAVHYPAPIRQYISKEGIFSIDISLQSPDYNALTLRCREQIIKRTEISQTLFNISSTIHIYHLHQIQRLLEEVVKKKKNKHNPGSRSFINDKMFSTFQYLLWNIVHKSWLMAQVLSKAYSQNIDHFEAQLVSFLDKTQISLPISAVGAIQISILMNRPPPVLKDSDFGRLTHFIGRYRHYAYKQRMLQAVQPKWGKLQQFKDFFGNCFHLALSIGSLLDPNQNNVNLSKKEAQELQGFRDQMRLKHRMFSSSSPKTWLFECLKLIERKLLYYFSFTNELKKNQTLSQFKEKSSLFDNYFKLREIYYEFKNFKRNIMPEALEAKNTQLMELYLEVQLGEKQPDTETLADFKGKISPEYMPIFTYLCQQLEQKTLFNQKDLVIFARARNFLYDEKPYVYIRKRTLLTEYLGKVLKKKALKVSYFSLTDQTLNIFQKSQNNNCEVLCMILTVDSTTDGMILFGSEEGVHTVPMSLKIFAEKIRKCRIKMLILCGRNSKAICERLKEMFSQGIGMQSSGFFPNSPNMLPPVSASLIKTKNLNTSLLRSKIVEPPSLEATSLPTLIAIQNSQFSLCDAHIFNYSCPEEPPSSETHPSTKHSLFNRQPSISEDNSQIELFQNPDFIKNIIEQATESFEPEQKISIVEPSGRVRFPEVSLKQAQSQSEEESRTGIEQYISNEVNQIGMDLIVVTIIKNIATQLKDAPKVFQEHELADILRKSIGTVKHILKNRFECVEDVFDHIETGVWTNKHSLPQIQDGDYEDLTKKFYCAENNLNDENYYENIGNCREVGQAIDSLAKNTSCIEILGGNPATKANLLQELCWISQSKSLFKFGIIKLDLKEQELSRLASKEFAERQNSSSQTGLLIALDNVELLNPTHSKQLERLRGKLFTLLYTTSSAQKGEELRQLLYLREYRCIDLDKRSSQDLNNEVYANLLCHIKQKNEFMFDSEKLLAFESKVQEIMKIVQIQNGRERMSKALQLLRGGRSEQEKLNSFLHFYQQHYEELLNTLMQVREITVKFK